MPGEKQSILLVGAGRMGGALLNGWLASDIDADVVTVVEPAPAIGERRVSVVTAADELEEGYTASAVVFAVKPQVMNAVVPLYGRFVGPDSVVLSIAAGKTSAYIGSRIGAGAGAAVVRAMPNTPAAIARGITVAFANDVVNAVQRDLCQRLLGAVGEVIWSEDESLLDAVTAVSGGGPAYVFLLIECLAHAGTEAGLPAETALRLARATVCGAGELARQSDDPPDVLRRNVTSPGGTTLAALNVLMADDGIAPVFVKAIAAATARSRELAE